jgi:hypothetical protein
VLDSYEDTLKWVVANCGPDDWQIFMDMPALYSLARRDAQGYKGLLEEVSNSSKAGYSSSTQARISLSFKTKVHGIFAGEYFNNCHHFGVIYKWVSTGLKKGSRDQVEDVLKDMEASLSRKMGVHLVNKHNNAHRFFLSC